MQPVTGFPGVTLETGVRCRLRDGVELFADVYRPDAAGGPYPVGYSALRMESMAAIRKQRSRTRPGT